MLASKRPDVRCRLIEEADIDSVVDCLRRGFPYRLRTYWARAMERMSARPAIDDFPRYGYLLEAAGGVVGVILLIYSRQEERPDRPASAATSRAGASTRNIAATLWFCTPRR